MAIDDPQSALEEQLRSEERVESPVATYLAKALEALPVGGLAEMSKFAGWWISREREARRKALIEVLLNEQRYVKNRLDKFSQEHERFMREDFPGLVLDALEKAEQTRSQDRVERMARILAHTMVSELAADLTEELVRIAMGLDDADVLVLGELVRGQRSSVAPSTGQVGPDAANNYWRTGDVSSDVQSAVWLSESPAPQKSAVAHSLKMTEGELQSRCAKLQSYGLIVQVERNHFKNWPGHVPYAVLVRGVEFVDSVRSFRAENSAQGHSE